MNLRLGAVCTGAFLLADAGLLRGRRATTHWASCDMLAKLYPDISVERAPIYTRDGNVYTSAGATAGMDLAVALGREDLGMRWHGRSRAGWYCSRSDRPGKRSSARLLHLIRSSMCCRNTLAS
jgi:transcriptional regulator GlxA family with amidase domain